MVEILRLEFSRDFEADVPLCVKLVNVLNQCLESVVPLAMFSIFHHPNEAHLNHLMLWKWVADVCHQEFELDRIDRAASILVQRSECQSYLLIVSSMILLTMNSHRH